MEFGDEEAEIRFLESSLLDVKLPVFIQPVHACRGKESASATASEAPSFDNPDYSVLNFVDDDLTQIDAACDAVALPTEKPVEFSVPSLYGNSPAMEFEDEEAEMRFLESSLLDAKLPVSIQPVHAYRGKESASATASDPPTPWSAGQA